MSTPMITEAALDKQCRAEAEARGGLLLRMRPPPIGVPDRLLLMPGGHMVFIELKATKGALRPGQTLFLAELSRRRVPWIVARSFADFLALLTTLESIHADFEPCISGDPLCPCQDGLACHYKDTATTKRFPL